MAGQYTPEQIAALQQYQLQAQQQLLQQQQAAQGQVQGVSGAAAAQAQLQVQQQLAQQAAQQAQLQQLQQQQQAAQQAQQQALSQQQQAQMQQQAQLQAHQQAAAAQQAQTQGGEQSIGNERNIQVNGCTHGTVGTIVRGTFTLHGENHGRPTWKKDVQVNGLDVMCYFWDQRDGAAFSGWWFGPKVGGDQVWAYHASQAATPPVNNWKVPYDGPIDPTFIISKATTAYGQVAQNPMAQLQAQQQLAMQQQQDLKNNQAQQQQAQLLAAQQQAQLQQQYQQQQNQSAYQQIQQNQDKGKDKGKGKGKDKGKNSAEQQAAINVRKVISKLGGATETNFETLRAEIDAVLQQNLPACGTQAERIMNEARGAVQKAHERVEQTKATKKKMEEQREQMQRKKEEALVRIQTTHKELEVLVDLAEATSKALKEKADSLSEDKDIDEEQIKSMCKSIEEAGNIAREKNKGCTDFISQKGNDLKPTDLTGQGNDLKQQFQKLVSRVHDTTRGTEQILMSAKAAASKANRRAEAKKKLNAAEALFDKYDTNKDGFMEKKDILKYALGECDFQVENDTMDTIWKCLVVEGTKGVSKATFHKLKMFVGAARERAIDQTKRAAREAKQKELDDIKEKFKEKIEEANKKIDEIIGSVVEVEKKATALQGKAKTESAADLSKLADEVDEAVKRTRDEVAACKTHVAEVAEGAEEAVKGLVSAETKKLEQKLAVDPRLKRAENLANKCREDIRKKENEELYKIEKHAIGMLKFHQSKNSLSGDAMFEAVDTGKDGKIDATEFINFFKTCDKETKAGEDTATEAPSDEDLARLFGAFDEESEGALSKEQFTSLVKVYMKVSRETVITEDLSIKDSRTLRRLEVNEVVEIIDGPSKEPSVEVLRVKAHVMKDHIEGWITIEGNQGTKFLADGGDVFKVVKETVLTPDFELDTEKDKETQAKVQKATRKLKVGEVVTVREWAKKEESSGMMRMKCKVKSDGQVGYVTTIGTGGTVFAEVV